MSIACVAYGSIVWDPRDLPHIPQWKKDGPFLPVEFTDHEKNRMCLTLTEGAEPIQTLWARMTVSEIDDAIKYLAERERMTPEELEDRSVGYWTATRSQGMCHETVGKWARAKGLTGAVWTSLKPRFKEEYGRIPSEDEVIEFLRELIDRNEHEAARDYIIRSPVTTKYKLRIMKEFSWE
jgi:hypothetical protein